MSTRQSRRLGWIVGGSIFFTLYVGLLMYPAARLANLIWPTVQIALPLAVVFAAPILIRIWVELRPSNLTRTLSRWSLTFIGACFVAWFPVVVFELANLVLDLESRTTGVVLTAAIAATCVYACWNAQNIRIRPLSIPSQPQVRGTRIAQVSDLHIGSLHPRQLAQTVRKLNELKPDYAVLTGDIVDFKDIPGKDLAPFAAIEAPVVFVIGNHERYVDVEEICQRLTHHGVTVLRNAAVELGHFQFVGIDDAERKDQVARLITQFTPAQDKYRVLLYHRPDGAEQAAAWGANLMLTGHTHNGQIVPFNYLVKRYFHRITGLYQIDDMHLFVSTGTGVWGPVLRLGSRSEITAIDLV